MRTAAGLRGNGVLIVCEVSPSHLSATSTSRKQHRRPKLQSGVLASWQGSRNLHSIIQPGRRNPRPTCNLGRNPTKMAHAKPLSYSDLTRANSARERTRTSMATEGPHAPQACASTSSATRAGAKSLAACAFETARRSQKRCGATGSRSPPCPRRRSRCQTPPSGRTPPQAPVQAVLTEPRAWDEVSFYAARHYLLAKYVRGNEPSKKAKSICWVFACACPLPRRPGTPQRCAGASGLQC